MDLQESREVIRQVDEEMAKLFVKRMEAVRSIAAYKKERGIPIEDKDQEARVIKGRSALVEDPELRSFYVNFLQDTMDVSKRWQHNFLQDTMDVSKRWQHYLMKGLRVAYSGVEGAFAHIAAGRIFPDGELESYPSFESAYEAVEKGECDVAVLPIENSFAGEVGQVLDLMFSGDLYVNGVYDLSINQNLLGLPGTDVSGIRTVYSHPQAISQCRSYIRKHGFDAVSMANTALAAQKVAQDEDRSTAAIASEETADLYGLQILDHDINESKVNTTRFAVFSRVETKMAIRKDAGAFLLLFTVKDEAGGLAKAVNVISAYNFNMRVLRSRPMKDLPWHYYFYAEVEGDDSSENGKRMISALRGTCPGLKVVGRYTATSNIQQGGETI